MVKQWSLEDLIAFYKENGLSQDVPIWTNDVDFGQDSPVTSARVLEKEKITYQIFNKKATLLTTEPKIREDYFDIGTALAWQKNFERTHEGYKVLKSEVVKMVMCA